MVCFIFILWVITSFKLVKVTRTLKSTLNVISYRSNKYGEIYDIQTNLNEMSLIRFWDNKICKWHYALEVVNSVDGKQKVLKIRRFKIIYALTLAHNIKMNTFVRIHCKNVILEFNNINYKNKNND